MIHDLAIITVVYENYTVLNDFLNSFKKQTNKSFKLFLVDLSKNKKEINNTEVDFHVFYADNKGYAHGVNQGLQHAIKQGFEKFCVINNDVSVKNNFVNNIINSLSTNKNALVGGKIYYANGYEYHKHYGEKEKSRVIWYAGGKVDWKHATTHHLHVDEVDNGQADKLSGTGFITGCLMFFSKYIVNRIGYWDESYFMYYEDADYCERAKKAEVNLLYDPNVVIWHKNAQSTGGSGSKFHQKYLKKNKLKFGLKYAPWRTKLHLLKNYFI